MFTTSLLLKNNNSILVASRLSLPSAHFSRRSNNKPFKVVKARINKLDGKLNKLHHLYGTPTSLAIVQINQVARSLIVYLLYLHL